MGKIILGILSAAGFVVIGLSFVLGTANEAAEVTREEFGPRAALEKYEWFKDVAANLEAKQADIRLAENKLKSLEEAYDGTPRGQWPRDDRQQHALYMSEVQGIKQSYNLLAAEYNAAMVKFNYRFANVGELPQGASEPLPREFKEYSEQ